MLSITVDDLRLSNDTGASATDQVTADPTLAGTAVCTGYSGNFLVQFDLDNDSVADAQRTTTGNFSYRPFGLEYGSHTVQARAGKWDTTEEAFVFGDWSQLSFTLEAAPLPAVVSLGLLNDTGASSTDGITRDITLHGDLSSSSYTGSITVQFDHDEDGQPDGLSSSGEEGEFAYVPHGLLYGEHTVAARSRVWDAVEQAFAYGDWFSLSFSFEAPPLPH